MLANEPVAVRDDGQLVLVVMCQLAAVAMVLACSVLFVPELATAVAMGSFAAVAPSAIVALVMRRAKPNLVVVYAMMRSLLVAIVVVSTFIVVQPATLAYFAGAGIGVALIALMPLVFARRAARLTSTER